MANTMSTPVTSPEMSPVMTPVPVVRVVRGPASRRTRVLRWALVLAVCAITLGARMAVVLRSGGLGGIDGYDDGVYYAAAASFVFGKLPYRDFLLLHPPGVMLVLTPIAALGRLAGDRTGFELARLLAMVVGTLNTALVVVVARRRFGALAAATAGLWYALWPLSLPTETTIRLEPLVSLGLLLALACVVPGTRKPRTSRLLYAGGLALGFAASVKVWAVVPALVIIWWAWRWWGRRGVAATVAGAATSCLLIDGPFWLAAPGAMWRMVVADQLGRGHTPVGAASRLVQILVPGVTPPETWNPGAWSVAAAVGGLLLVASACRDQHVRAVTSLLAATVAVMLLSPSFYSYYPAFAAPFVALVVAGVLARCARGLPLRRTLNAVVAAGTLVALVAAAWMDAGTVVSFHFPARELAGLGRTSRCITSDSPDALLLTGSFTRNLRRGCPAPVDLSGLTYDADALPLRPDGTGVPRATNPAWQEFLWSYLASGQTVFVMRPGPDGMDPSSPETSGLVLRASGDGYAVWQHHPAIRTDGPQSPTPR